MFFVILSHFLAFDPLNNLRKQNFGKMKITRGDIIILNMCATNDDHRMYGSWNMDCNRQIFLSFWAILALLPHYQAKKSKFWKAEKKPWRYHHFTQVQQKSWSYAIPALKIKILLALVNWLLWCQSVWSRYLL